MSAWFAIDTRNKALNSAGMVIAEIALSYFRLFYQDIDIGPGSRILLLHRAGQILVGKP